MKKPRGRRPRRPAYARADPRRGSTPVRGAGLSGHPELRASFVGSQVRGLALARHVIELPELVPADREVLVGMLAPVLDRYLTQPVIPPA